MKNDNTWFKSRLVVIHVGNKTRPATNEDLKDAQNQVKELLKDTPNVLVLALRHDEHVQVF